MFTAVIIKIDNGCATLDIGRGKQISIPSKFLPQNVKESDTVIIELLSPIQFEARQKNIAKALLKEILGADEAKTTGQKAKS